jgi:hypothetical protein
MSTSHLKPREIFVGKEDQVATFTKTSMDREQDTTRSKSDTDGKYRFGGKVTRRRRGDLIGSSQGYSNRLFGSCAVDS